MTWAAMTQSTQLQVLPTNQEASRMSKEKGTAWSIEFVYIWLPRFRASRASFIIILKPGEAVLSLDKEQVVVTESETK